MLNKDNIVFTENIIVNIDIEDVTPVGILNDGEINESLTINQSNLAPNDSVYFEKNLLVNPQEFGVAGVDLVVVWPQVSANDGVINEEADIELTYVKEEIEFIDNEISYDFIPGSIQDYIDEHYPNFAIANISTIQSNFIVELNNGLELIFSLEGNLLNAEGDKHNYMDDDDDGKEEEEDSDDDDDNREDDDDDSSDDDNSDNDDDDGDSDDDDGDSDDDEESPSDDDDEDEENLSGDDDDESNSYSDDDDHHESKTDDDDEGDKKDGNSDDKYREYLGNKEIDKIPFKVIINNQSIQVISADDYEILEVELCSINGVINKHKNNQNKDRVVNLSIKNIANYFGIVRVFMLDKEQRPKEFYHKVIFGF